MIIYHTTKVEIPDKKAREIALKNGWVESVDNPAYSPEAPEGSPQAQNPKTIPNPVRFRDIVSKVVKEELDRIIEESKKQWQ